MSSHSSEESQGNKDANGNDKRYDRILFESLVDNERSYLCDVLRSKIFNKQRVHLNPLTSFIKWLPRQFETISTKPTQPSLIYNLEHLKKKINTEGLFERKGRPDTESEYLSRIRKGINMNLEDAEIEDLALAQACRGYIRADVEFFDHEINNRIKEIYGQDTVQSDRAFFAARLPFIMQNRMAFRLIRDLVHEQAERSKVSLERSIELWSSTVLSEELERQTREAVLKDLLDAEFEYVPLAFYE